MNKFLTISSIVLSMLSFQAAAIDSKIHSGSMCQALFGSQDANLNKGAGRVINSSNATMWVSCPIIRDNTLNSNGINVAFIRVTRSANAGDPIMCILDNRNSNGSQSNFQTRSFSGVGFRSIRFDLNSSNNRGHYEFLCRLPRNSSIQNYRVDEF